ncbi:unnamed protein product [Gongylonema pulchrum]|uniref:Uncharacterized protein n=1 Tax=Gongylonema pulchrum TaxID=637853 RepID=A0A183D847_9BILA|nr:unnamed protein product [Gongylonema pulchrum]
MGRCDTQSLLSKIRASEKKRLECEAQQEDDARNPGSSNSAIAKMNSIVKCHANTNSPIVHIDANSSPPSCTDLAELSQCSGRTTAAGRDFEKQKGDFTTAASTCTISAVAAAAITAPLCLHLAKHSVIRANLLSPLSFDDLNYSTKPILKLFSKANANQLL